MANLDQLSCTRYKNSPTKSTYNALRKKRSYSELFWSVCRCGQIRTSVTANTDTFHAVTATLISNAQPFFM